MVRAFGDETLLLLEGKNGLVEIRAKVGVVGTSDRELKFRLLRITGKHVCNRKREEQMTET